MIIGRPALAIEKHGPEDKVAVVNGSTITQENFNREMNAFRQRLLSEGRSLSDSQLLEMKKDILESLINTELLYQDAQRQGIKIDEADIDKELMTVKERFPNEVEFKNALSKMNLSEADLRSEIKRGLAVQHFVDKKFAQGIAISDKETKAYYDGHRDSFKEPERMRASHILIKFDSRGEKSQKAASRKKIEKVQQKLKKGEDFAALAKEFSEGPSAAKGGDLGYFTRGQMVKPFDDAAFALKPGEVSDIVETRFGYHLIKAVEKKPEGIIAYAEVKDRLQEHLKQKKVRDEVSSYIKELRGKAKIERFMDKNQHDELGK
jgi:peptidyl-prolyl cis-trans isomerase C